MKLKFIRTLMICMLLLVFTTLAISKTYAKHHTAKKELVNISVSGVKDETILKNINSALKNIKSTHLTTPINDDSIYSIYSDAPKGIKNAMQPYGYFNPD